MKTDRHKDVAGLPDSFSVQWIWKAALRPTLMWYTYSTLSNKCDYSKASENDIYHAAWLSDKKKSAVQLQHSQLPDIGAL